jgi:hypothetical protein
LLKTIYENKKKVLTTQTEAKRRKPQLRGNGKRIKNNIYGG